MPASMDSWVKLEGRGDSFEELFKKKLATPLDHSTSLSMKTLSVDEIHSSGPSLRSLGKLEVDQLTLTQGYDYSWAMEMLSTYGPMGLPHSWDPNTWRYAIFEEILDENSVVKYLEEVFLSRALCGGFFLFALATGLDPPIRCPAKESARFINQSSSGPSGRPDLQLVRNGNLCGSVEVKTRRVCLIDGRDGIDERDVLDMVGEVSLLYGDQGFTDTLVTGSEKKATTILYQVGPFTG
jgi:hypothetical protein